MTIRPLVSYFDLTKSVSPLRFQPHGNKEKKKKKIVTENLVNSVNQEVPSCQGHHLIPQWEDKLACPLVQNDIIIIIIMMRI